MCRSANYDGSGSHTSLIEKSGVYYNLVKNQLELGN